MEPRINGARLRAATLDFARQLVPLAASVKVAVHDKAIAFFPRLGVFMDAEVFAIQAAILGESVSDRWTEGSEPMAPLDERCEWAEMPGFEDAPTAWVEP